MDDESIAYVLGISYDGCAGMTGQDVVELYSFLLAKPTLQSNPVRYWLNILDRRMGQPDDRHLVDLAILRFGRRSRPRRVG